MLIVHNGDDLRFEIGFIISSLLQECRPLEVRLSKFSHNHKMVRGMPKRLINKTYILGGGIFPMNGVNVEIPAQHGEISLCISGLHLIADQVNNNTAPPSPHPSRRAVGGMRTFNLQRDDELIYLFLQQ